MVDVQASSGGRRITLDPMMARDPLTIQPVRVESAIPAGFRIDWLSGEDEKGMTFNLACGAGVGSPYMTLTVKQDDVTVGQEIVDMRDVVKVWIPALVAAGPTPEVSEPGNS